MKNTSPVVLCVTAGVGGWTWLIFVTAMKTAAPLWQFKKRDPSSDSIVLASTFLMVMHSMLTGTLSGG